MSESSRSDVVSFTIMGDPVGKGRPRFRKNGSTYTPAKTKAYEEEVQTQYGIQAKNYRFADIDMLDLRIIAYYSIPKSKAKAVRSLMAEGTIRPTKKPDMDNVMKIIADSLNGIAYKDDTQIVDAQCRKFYSDTPRVEVTIRRAEQRRKKNG